MNKSIKISKTSMKNVDLKVLISEQTFMSIPTVMYRFTFRYLEFVLGTLYLQSYIEVSFIKKKWKQKGRKKIIQLAKKWQ